VGLSGEREKNRREIGGERRRLTKSLGPPKKKGNGTRNRGGTKRSEKKSTKVKKSHTKKKRGKRVHQKGQAVKNKNIRRRKAGLENGRGRSRVKRGLLHGEELGERGHRRRVYCTKWNHIIVHKNT